MTYEKQRCDQPNHAGPDYLSERDRKRQHTGSLYSVAAVQRLTKILAKKSTTPHIGYVAKDEYQVQFTDIFDQIVAYTEGTPTNVVNPGVMANRR